MIPPFPEPFLAYSNVPRTGADFQGKVRQIFIAPATKAHEKKLDRLEQVEKAAGMLDDLDCTVDDFLASRLESARHGW